MDEQIESKINELGAKIDIVESLSKGIETSIYGCDELTQKDTFNFISLLSEKLKDLKFSHDEIIDKLKI